MTLFRALPLALLLLAGCSGETALPEAGDTPAAPPEASASVPPPPQTAVPEGSTPITAIGDLIGEYRVAGIDGAELGGDMGIAVSVDGPRLSYEPTCAGFVWDISDKEGELAFTRATSSGPTRRPDGSIMVCAVAVPTEFEWLGEAIDAARRAWRTPANGVLLEGGGRSVLLFSQ